MLLLERGGVDEALERDMAGEEEEEDSRRREAAGGA